MPSGSGITAATVMAGGPPTNTFTRSISLAPQGRGMMGGDAAVNLVVQPDLAVRLVLPAGKLHAIHAQVACGQARAGRGLRCRPAAA